VVAAHLLLAEPAGDLRSREVLHRAAQQAMERGAYTAAAALLRRALAEAPRVKAPEIYRDLGIAEATYDATAAAEDLRTAYELSTDVHSRRGVAGALSEVLLLAGQPAGAAQLLGSELAGLAGSAGDDADPDARLRLVAQWGQAALGSGIPRADVYERVRAAAATASSETPAYAVAATVAALSAANGTERREWALVAAARPDRLPMSGPASSLMPQLVNALCMDAEVETATTLSERMARVARTSGSALAAAIARYCTGLSGITAGRVADAEADAAAALEFAREGGWELGVTMSAVLLARAMLERGRPDDAERVLHDVAAGAGLSALEHQTMRVRVLLAQRRHEDALKLVTEIDDVVASFGMVGHLVLRAHALVGLGRAEEAVDSAERVLATVRDRGVRLGIAEALTAVAMACDTVDAWRAAVEEVRDGPYRLLTARALTGLGAALRRDRQPKLAREVLEQALDLAHRCAATGLEDEVRTELAATGARPRRTAVTGVAALTAAELRVCRLAAQNLSNEQVAQALFVSVKTVETQLSSAYRKLGVRGRPELASALASDPPD
jgi:DNA-binding CsgD family transcriptional regulator